MLTFDDLKEITDFFGRVAGADYKSPSKVVDAKEKQKYIEYRQRTEQVQEMFYSTITDIVRDMGFILIEHHGFLDGTRRRIRDSFWVELRKESKVSSPESISVFLEKTGEKIHIRISNDIYESKCTLDALLKHNNMIMEMLPRDCMVYLNKAGTQGVYTKNVDEARELINGKTITKVQACRIMDISILTENNSPKIKEAINQLIPIYDALS
ncbi:hypothetical protein [Lachnobacterium bovis]|uniref:hypothetical protein n=1 Tax=Lachnobacterium bovis TaxID=140626 RepID=UPI000483592C|nr:hypothetical protein [Lachnobacterium bovis]